MPQSKPVPLGSQQTNAHDGDGERLMDSLRVIGLFLLASTVCGSVYLGAIWGVPSRALAQAPRPAPAATDDVPPAKSPAPKIQPTGKAQAEAKPAPAADHPAGKMDKTTGVERALTAAQQADELAIRGLAKVLEQAYRDGDAAAAVACFTVDAEYVDEQGNAALGRAAIAECLTDFFSEHPSCELEFHIDTIRFVAPGIAIEDGATRIVHSEDIGPVDSRYTAVQVKQPDGKWLTASVRDYAQEPRHEHASKLQELDWLLGEWVDEGDDAVVTFDCEAVDSGNYLLRKFTVHVAGQESLSGTQRIGWDSVNNRFRVWLFDSEGGFGEGTLRRSGDGDGWILRMAGITADGKSASGTSVYTLVNDHTMTWQNIEHEIAGEEIPDSDVVTIVQRAPPPKFAEAKEEAREAKEEAPEGKGKATAAKE